MPLAVVTGANSGIGHAFAQLLLDQVSIPVTNQPFTKNPHNPHNPKPGLRRPRLRPRRRRRPAIPPRAPPSPRRAPPGIHRRPRRPARQQTPPPPPQRRRRHGPSAQDALATTTKTVLTTTFETNAFGPLLPNLLLAAERGEEAKVGIVSSRVGSMGDNATGGSYAYRASKAAVNSVGKSLSVDLREKGVVVCLLHPGIVRTNLNPGAEHAEAVEAEEAATKLWEVVKRVGVEERKFWHREGYELPW